MKTTLIILCSFFLFFSCNNTSKENKAFDEKISDVIVDEKKEHKPTEEIVFYNIFSPVDLEKIINKRNSYFNSNFLNKIDNITSYTQSHKIALNIGVYGADLSYLWTFEQTQQALTYMASIEHLTNKLGIPNEYIDLSSKSVKENSQNVDSIAKLARDTYTLTDNYLKNNNNENESILILLGGWIETLFISTQIYKNTDPVLASKIITQKYALNSIITRMQNYQDDLIFAEYLILLKNLNQAFVVFEKRLKPGDIEIDTTNKRITIKENNNLNIEPQELDELRLLVSKIRNHIID